jgi:hypothetical protein
LIVVNADELLVGADGIIRSWPGAPIAVQTKIRPGRHNDNRLGGDERRLPETTKNTE